MAESQSVGGIHYDVAMDVKPMLSGERQVGSSLDRMEGNFNKASKSIDSAEKSMLSFSKAALAVSSAISVGAIVNMVDEWGQVAARIKMALKSVEGDIEKYASIQERFLEISNRNGKAIEDTQLLYVGAATSMQELGYSTEQTIDYIESLSSSLTANASSANETQSMINALNKAMVSGKVAGENWNSIMNATPTLIGDIAKQLSIMRGGVKVTEQDVKKLAADGKISFQLFADAVIRAKEANNAMADSMDNTVADGFTKLTNSAKAYFGELNQSLGITREISAGFAVLSNNFDKVAAAAVIASAVIGSRMVGAMAESIKTKISDIAASNNQAQATLQAARADQYAATAAVKKSLADKGSTASAVALAQAEYNVAKGSAAEATALENLIVKKTAARNASLAHAQALKIESASILATGNAARAASTGLGALRAGLALIGGPMGAAMLAAGAIFYFYQKSQEAKQETLAFADSIEELKNKMKDMSDVALMGNIAEASKSIDAQKESIQDLKDELEILQDNYSYTARNTAEFQNRSENLEKIQRDIAIKAKELEEAQSKLARTTKYVSDATQELTDRNKDLYDAMNNASGASGKMGAAIGALQQRIKAAADEKERLNNKMKESPETDDGKKYIQNLKDQNELLNIQDKKKRAIKKAEIEASKITENKGQIDAAKKLAEENFNLSEAERKRESASKKATSTGESESKKRANQLLELANANKVAELETKGLYREAAILESVLKLGAAATKAQIAEVSDLAGKEFDLKQKIKDREDAYKQNAGLQAARDQKLALEQLDRQFKANLVTEEQYQKRRAEINAEYSRKIAEENARLSISPAQEMAGKVNPIQALQNENTQKLALIKEYMNQKILTEQEGLAMMDLANKEYEQNRVNAMYDLWRNQSLGNEAAAAAFDSLAGNASNALTGIITQSMTAADAARSLGRTVLNSLINSYVQAGIEQAKAAWFGAAQQEAAIATTTAAQVTGIGVQTAASTAAAATTTAAWTPAAIMSSIASWGGAVAIGLGAIAAIGLSGKRKNGGNVKGGAAYEVGEENLPELMQIGNKLIAIPGNNGRVFSYDDVTGSAVIPKASTGRQYINSSDNNRLASNKGMQGKDGNSGFTVIINNTGNPMQVTDQREFTAQDGQRFIELWCNNFAQGLETRRVVNQFTTANSKAVGSL